MAYQKRPVADLRVSAIVPVYNVEKYVARCLDSLIEQTVPFFEIVVVDDGSTDGSSLICADYASRHETIRIIKKSNAGLGYARNTGLRYISPESEYVMFIDSDDWLEPDCVESYGRAAISSDADCILAGYAKCHDNGAVREIVQIEEGFWEADGITDCVLPRIFGSSPSASDAIPMSVCSCLLSTAPIRSFNLNFPSEREVISEDFVFKFQYLVSCTKVKAIPYTGYCYRDNPSSLTTSYRSDRFEASLGFYYYAKDLAERVSSAGLCIERLKKSLFIYVRACIAQERKSVSGKGYREARKSISLITGDKRLIEIVDSYPVAKLGFKQRAFLFLVRNKADCLLQVISELHLI